MKLLGFSEVFRNILNSSSKSHYKGQIFCVTYHLQSEHIQFTYPPSSQRDYSCRGPASQGGGSSSSASQSVGSSSSASQGGGSSSPASQGGGSSSSASQLPPAPSEDSVSPPAGPRHVQRDGPAGREGRPPLQVRQII